VTEGHEEYLELAAIHTLRPLEGPERARFELHLASGCDPCDVALREFRMVAEELLYAVTPASPPPHVKSRLMSRLRREREEPVRAPAPAPVKRPEPRRAGVGFWLPLGTAAAVIAAAGFALYTRSLQRELDAERAATRSAIEELAGVRASLDAFTAPATRAVSLAGRGSGAQASARAFVDAAGGRLFLYVEGLPPSPPGRTYQIWLIIGANPPVSAGVFEVQPNGQARLESVSVPSFDGAVTVAVTVEPAGGVPQPTGEMVLVGS
jgi:anti-sigma-K factor RskA